VAYIRVSKEEQTLGLEAQRAAIEAWAARQGVQVPSWRVDRGVCSVTPIDERKELLGALADLRETRAGILVVARRDRIAREVVLAAAVGHAVALRGARLVSTAGEGTDGDSPTDRLLAGITDLFAEFERSLIRSRTRAALAVKRARGERTTSQLPYGWALGADGIRLAPVAHEQATIEHASRLRAAGLSYSAIAAELSQSRRTRSGRPFAPMQVYRMTLAR